MQPEMRERVLAAAHGIAAEGETLRAAARRTGLGRSTLQKALRHMLPHVDPQMAAAVAARLAHNRREASARGGSAMRERRRAQDGVTDAAPRERTQRRRIGPSMADTGDVLRLQQGCLRGIAAHRRRAQLRGLVS